MKTTKKDILSYINQLQKIVKDKKYYDHQLNSNQLSELENNIIKNEILNKLSNSEDYLLKMIKFSLKNYFLQKGKPIEFNAEICQFLMEQEIK